MVNATFTLDTNDGFILCSDSETISLLSGEHIDMEGSAKINIHTHDGAVRLEVDMFGLKVGTNLSAGQLELLATTLDAVSKTLASHGNEPY